MNCYEWKILLELNLLWWNRMSEDFDCSPQTPGEGEHKIMDFIRSEKLRPDYDANTRHCLYGLDADLVRILSYVHDIIWMQVVPEIRTKFQRKINIQLSWQTKKIHLYIKTFCFLNFTNIINFWVWAFHENVQNYLPFHIFFKKSISPKWCIRLYCTDPAN